MWGMSKKSGWFCGVYSNRWCSFSASCILGDFCILMTCPWKYQSSNLPTTNPESKVRKMKRNLMVAACIMRHKNRVDFDTPPVWGVCHNRLYEAVWCNKPGLVFNRISWVLPATLSFLKVLFGIPKPKNRRILVFNVTGRRGHTQGISFGNYRMSPGTTRLSSRTEKTRPARCYLKARKGESSRLSCFLGGNSNIFSFHPYLGKISSLSNIFQGGWDHQLVFRTRFIGCWYSQKTIPRQLFWRTVGQMICETSRNPQFFSNTWAKQQHLQACMYQSVFFRKPFGPTVKRSDLVNFGVHLFLISLSRRWRRCRVLPKSQAAGPIASGPGFNLPERLGWRFLEHPNHPVGFLKTTYGTWGIFLETNISSTKLALLSRWFSGFPTGGMIFYAPAQLT